MCTVSKAEFVNDPAKYLDIARYETVYIEDEDQTFILRKVKSLSEKDEDNITGKE